MAKATRNRSKAKTTKSPHSLPKLKAKPPTKKAAGKKRPIEQYEHPDKKRKNNPPVGLVTPETDPLVTTKKTYRYDPHIDPDLQFDSGLGKGIAAEIENIMDTGLRMSELPEDEGKSDPAETDEEGQLRHELECTKEALLRARQALTELKQRRRPYLNWAGKAERTTFGVPTVSLHVHERIDPRTIIDAVRTKNGSTLQLNLFDKPSENPPLREAIDFYRHEHGWTNRLIAGDSLLVMNSLLEKEGMGGKVQMVYIDPPYGVDYASNFQPFVNNRTVRDRDQDLTQEPETIKAFRDTWELGVHSYLTYLRDRFFVAREMLAPSGSIFVQIGVDQVHLVRAVLDDMFQAENCMAQIIFRKKMMPLSKKPGCESMTDYLLWYARSKPEAEPKLRQLFIEKAIEGDASWNQVELQDGTRRTMTTEEINNHRQLPEGSRVYQTISNKPREYRENQDFNFNFNGKVFPPPGGTVEKTPDGVHCWSTTKEGMQRLAYANRLQIDGNSLRYVFFHADYPVTRLTGLWSDTAPPKDMHFVVETAPLVVQRCILMTTGPGDLVLDPTCGSGTTAYVAEQWGRRWITCDSSRVALALARQRLMAAQYPYHRLARPTEGVSGGFEYRTVPHVTRGEIANNEGISAGMSRTAINEVVVKYSKPEVLYDSAQPDEVKARVTGPFTVEAVPAPVVSPVSEHVVEGSSDLSVAHEGETLRQAEWRAELLKTGVRGKGGQMIKFNSVEPLPGARYLHADAEVQSTAESGALAGKRVVVSFGPEHAPLEQRQVELAWEEARTLSPKPAVLLFAAFQFDPEAAKDIEELKPQKTGMAFLKAEMNRDLATEDLKKKRASNESFWLIGQPDIDLRQITKGAEKDKWQVEVNGFDYFNTKSGKVESGDTTKIAMWMLDTDYDGRSLYPRQVFFPMAGPKDGWARLAANLKAEIDEDKIEAYRGTLSLPFEPGKHKRVAVKLIDDRGIESLVVRNLD